MNIEKIIAMIQIKLLEYRNKTTFDGIFIFDSAVSDTHSIKESLEYLERIFGNSCGDNI